MRTSRRRAGAKVENIFSFSKARFFAPSLARAPRDARAPNQGCGLACADQGHPRAALDANDLWIRYLGAQHPVESYRQLARGCYFRHTFRLLVTAMQILFTKSRIKAHCDLRGFHQQRTHQPVALLGDRSQLLPSARTFLARNQTQVTGYLLAPWKPARVTHGQNESQRGVWTHSRLRHQQLGLRMFLRG